MKTLFAFLGLALGLMPAAQQTPSPGRGVPDWEIGKMRTTG
jgi:hypothetical protein